MIDRLPLSQVAARRLQLMIKNGELTAGERLPAQRALAEKLGISRPSLREALLTLETLGQVRTYPGRGTFVTGPGAHKAPEMSGWRYGAEHSIQSVFEVRLLLEARLARHAAALTTLEDIALLNTLTDQMEEGWVQRDLVANVEADLAFHRIIAGKSTNLLLAKTYEQLVPLLGETQRQPIPFTPEERMSASITEHRSIIFALNARDPDAAEAAMTTHIRNTAACASVII